MCFGGSDASKQAAAESRQARDEARQEEEARKARIREGQGKIDESFAQFDDPYFGRFRTDYLGTKNPGIDDQYGRARDTLTTSLASRGILNSTIAGNAFGDLDRRRNDARADAANEAFDASNAFRNSVEKSKGDLYALNTSAADPSMIAARARGEATTLVPPKATSSLGDLFGSILAPFAAYQKASIYAPYRGSSTAPPTSGLGSGKLG